MKRSSDESFSTFFSRLVYSSDPDATTADTESDNIFPRKLTPEVLQALRGVRFIAQHIKDADKDNEVMHFAHPLIRSFFLGNDTFFCFLISDCSRMEIRFDGFGSIFIVGFYA